MNETTATPTTDAQGAAIGSRVQAVVGSTPIKRWCGDGFCNVCHGWTCKSPDEGKPGMPIWCNDGQRWPRAANAHADLSAASADKVRRVVGSLDSGEA